MEETGSTSSSSRYCGGYSNINFAMSTKMRMDTFRSCPGITSPAKNWSDVGFVYTGTLKHNVGHIICVECLRTVTQWTTKRVPFIEHYSVNKECSFVKKYRQVVGGDQLPVVDYYYGTENVYSKLSDRVRSFGEVESMCLPPASTGALARAGFFHLESGVKCFCCGIVIPEWEKNDIPLCEHYRVSPECPYLCNQLPKISPVIESAGVDD